MPFTKGKTNEARKIPDRFGDAQADYTFRIEDADAEIQQKPMCIIKKKSLMVNTGATSYIINNTAKFKRFDETFRLGDSLCGISS